MRVFSVPILVILGSLVTSETFGGGTPLTLEQTARLKDAQVVLVNSLALTENGSADSRPITDIVSGRLQQIGYTTRFDRNEPHDVTVLVKCEEQKTWEGMARRGGDADRRGGPLRLWRGPACQFTYSVDGLRALWQREVRADFEDAEKVAKENGIRDPGVYALRHLQAKLTEHEFPVLLAAEWGQPKRLVLVLKSPETKRELQLKIVSLLGDMPADQAFEPLRGLLENPALAPSATLALGNLGTRSTSVLIHLLETSDAISVQTAAAKGLGRIAASSGDERVIGPLITAMQKSGVDVSVQTEIAFALGGYPDERAREPLERLNAHAWAIRSDDPQIKRLREATDWAVRQLDHTSH